MQTVEYLIDEFRKRGMKATPQRVAICEFLQDNTSHPSIDEIFSNLKQRYPTISLNTVYKTLDLLVNIGEVKRLTYNPYKNNYDPDTSLHHHLVCQDCNKISDIQYDFGNIFSLPNKLKAKYQINNFQIEFQGLCEECQVKNRQ